ECWNYSGTTPTAPPSGTFTAITGGDYHTCALRSGVNTVACWGSNQWGQSSPPASEEFASISAGTTATCGLHLDGTAECWGGTEVPGWDDPPPSGPFATLSIGYYNGCGKDASQHLTCWGFSNPLLSNQPTGAVKAFALGMRDACAVLPD